MSTPSSADSPPSDSPPPDGPPPAVPVEHAWTSAAASAARPAPHEGDHLAARTPQDESSRELLETVQSISRLEESN